MLRKLAKVWKLSSDSLGLQPAASPSARAALVRLRQWYLTPGLSEYLGRSFSTQPENTIFQQADYFVPPSVSETVASSIPQYKEIPFVRPPLPDLDRWMTPTHWLQ